MIGGITSAVVISIVTAVILYQEPPKIPSEKELPDKLILENQKDLKEVKTFLTMYPNATTYVDRSGRLVVDYTVHKQFTGSQNVTRRLILRVFSDNDGRPQEMYLNCPDGKNSNDIYNDIVNYTLREECWTSPYYG